MAILRLTEDDLRPDAAEGEVPTVSVTTSSVALQLEPNRTIHCDDLEEVCGHLGSMAQAIAGHGHYTAGMLIKLQVIYVTT